jgi:RHS repeat-associated protein
LTSTGQAPAASSPSGDFSHPVGANGNIGGLKPPVAFDPSKATLLDSLTTPTQQVYVNPDGSHVAVISAGPVRFHDAAGWHNIDETLTPTAGGGLTATASPGAATLASHAAGTIAVPAGSGQVQLGHPGVADVAGVVSGPTVSFPAALATGIDLTETLMPAGGLEERVIISTPPSSTGASSNSYLATLTLPAGWSARAYPNGVEVLDSTGTVVGSFDGGLATDSAVTASGSGAQTPVAVSLAGLVGQTATVQVAIDPGWSADPARVFPVTIDPSWHQWNAGDNADTYVSSAFPSQSYWGQPELHVGTYNGGGEVDRSMLWWNLTGLPSGSSVAVAQATLSLYQVWAYSCTAAPMNVYTLSGGFYSTTTWANQPGGTNPSMQPSFNTGWSPNGQGGSGGCAQGWEDVDVTPLVSNWMTNSAPNWGMGVGAVSETDSTQWKKFSSAAGGAVPTLTISYDRPPAATAVGTPATGSSFTTVPTLSVAPVTDPDGDPVQYDFRLSSSSNPESGGIIESGWISGTSWTPPASALINGATYSWHVLTWDGIYPSATIPSWSSTFTYDLRLGDRGTMPMDTEGTAKVNLTTGNLVYGYSSHQAKTLAGAMGLSATFNSQAPVDNGLTGAYYDDSGDHNGVIDVNETPELVRTDPVVNFSWNGQPPYGPIPATYFNVRWTGYVTAPVTGTYDFGGTWDDGLTIKLGPPGGTPTTTVLSSTTPATAPTFQNGFSMTAGTAYPIEVDYDQLLYSANVTLMQVACLCSPSLVPSGWLSTTAPALPQSWSLSSGQGGPGYVGARIVGTSVVLIDAEGDTHAYTATGTDSSAFIPPVGEDGHLTRDTSGNLTLHGDDGATYVFNSSGGLLSAVTAADDLHPSATTAVWSGTPAKLMTLCDPVSTRVVQVQYEGNRNNTATASGPCQGAPPPANCPTNPPPNLAGPPAGSGMVCQISYFDGAVTNFWYNASGQLARIEDHGVSSPGVADPGSEITDFAYTNGALTEIREPLQADWVAAGHSDSSTIHTVVSYDTSTPARVTSITLAAPDGGSSTPRPSHTYSYTSATESRVHTAGITENPNFPWSTDVTFDANGRLVTETDADGVKTIASQLWDQNDHVVFSTDSAGRSTSHLYDPELRETDTFGPAPTDCFNAFIVPKYAPYQTNPAPPADCPTQGVPHSHTSYDEGMIGLAATYWANTGTSGLPAFHATGLDGVAAGQINYPSPDGKINQNWGITSPPSQQTAPYLELGPGNWSVRFTGEILAPSQPVNFSLGLSGNARLYIDDTLVCDNWTNTAVNFVGCGFGSSTATYSWTAGAPHRIRLDFAPGAGGANIQLRWNLAGTYASGLQPRYGLATTETTDDATPGSPPKTTTTSYTATGIGPEFGLPTQSTTAGLTTTTTYETPGTGFLRPVAKTLPGGTVGTPATQTTTAYYPASTAVNNNNPCGYGPTVEAGLADNVTDQTPASGSAVVNESFYDTGGRTVGQHTNADPWTCTSYDGRDRPSQTVYPAVSGFAGAGRTVSWNYAVGGNPLVTSEQDSANASTPTAGTITTQVDLLGRTLAYTDVWGKTTNYTYDQAGRETDLTGPDTSGPSGDLHSGFDAAGRLSSQSLDTTTIASPSYNATTGELSSVSYGNNTSLASITRDGVGRTTNTTFNTGSNPLTSDTVGYSQSGQAVTDTVDGTGSSYAYDAAGRLTGATVGAHSYAYRFDNSLQGSCPTGSVPAANAGADTNRTAFTDSFGGQTNTTTSCYDQADRLLSTTTSGISVDTTVTADGTGTVNNGTVTTPAFNTTNPGELLVALVSAGGANTSAQKVTVSGAGLTWTKAARQNTQKGDAEIWTATATTRLSGATVTSTETITTGKDQSLVVVALNGAVGVGATATANAATGAPTLNLTTTAASSEVYAVGYDKSTATAHTPGTNQITLYQRLDTAAGATMWYQDTTPGQPAGTNLTVNDTAPTADAWNLAAAEIVPAAPATSTVGYDAHGNTTAIFGQTIAYDAQDRQASTAASTTTVTYVRDATDRIIERDDATSSGTTVTRYSYTGPGDSPDLLLNANNAVKERDTSLPGGVLYSKRSAAGTDVWSYPDLHGDVVATCDSSGNETGGSFSYDPFGNALTGEPNNTNAPADDYGWKGQHQRPTDTATGPAIIEMGARLYLPSIGRFLRVDPVPGGSANNYDYLNSDPINGLDLNGQCWWGSCRIWHSVRRGARWVWRHAGYSFTACAGYCIGLEYNHGHFQLDISLRWHPIVGASFSYSYYSHPFTRHFSHEASDSWIIGFGGGSVSGPYSSWSAGFGPGYLFGYTHWQSLRIS